METCVRGFSFMPAVETEPQLDVINLQYIEGGELERTWKTTRRQRLKEREKKIWDEFVQEQDIVSTVCKDDPYQFLENLPESCLKELMDKELHKMSQELAEGETEIVEMENQDGRFESARNEDTHHVVTFADDDNDKNDNNVFHIFDDENDDASGQEDEGGSECTVREQCISPASAPADDELDKKSDSGKSVSVPTIIESSIYCAKLKDLRGKLNAELLSIINSIENLNLSNIDLDELRKIRKRSNEFCARFNRIYLYQLQRQLNDLKRHNSSALPFAKHTQFQSNMVRIVSVHQNIINCLQAFHKSFDQTMCLNESVDVLQTLSLLICDINEQCMQIKPPRDLSAALHLFTDDVVSSCGTLDRCVKEHNTKMTNFLDSSSNGSSCKNPYKTMRSNRIKKKPNTSNKKGGDSRLAMYSLDNKLGLHLKSSSSGTSKLRRVTSSFTKVNSNEGSAAKLNETEQAGNKKKTPRSRRPLMRDPQQGLPRSKQLHRDSEIKTMVEKFAPCASSHISREPSPQTHGPMDSLKLTPRTYRSKDSTPRARASNASTPRGRSYNFSPRNHQPQKMQVSPKRKMPSPRRRPREHVRVPSPNISKKPTQTTLSEFKEDENFITPVHKIKLNNNKTDVVTAVDKQVTEEVKKQKELVKRKESIDLEHGALHAQMESAKEVVDPKLPTVSPRHAKKKELTDNERRNKSSDLVPEGYEVSRLLRKLCGGDGSGCRAERVSGAKNAQLLCVSSNSPKQPSTPQLLRILEETIQKKVPKSMLNRKPPSAKELERLRLTFNLPEATSSRIFDYRSKFVQHMLDSAMYANCAVGKPWEMIIHASEQIIEDLISECAKEMELQNVVLELYRSEIH